MVPMAFLSATVCTEAAGNQRDVFEYTVPIDLTSIFTGYGPLPAVTGTENQTGDWNGENQTLTVSYPMAVPPEKCLQGTTTHIISATR
jgi:hypothetical protein